ncbi:27690_t:CDS:2 [Dentiscutata erythropus]|uniref:27690_t:CDS:1 n=1 Tax=Dentiscutata erythropus TaxID=1348616 RepID=A0A9N8WTJ1_9GLOM|nr:27690_t:CDS:2 [Dentiscutata erythropus]
MNNFTSIGKKIVAIGRNFSDHAKELGSTVPTSPIFFLKPTSSYLLQGGSVEVPKGSEVHHEGYALGIDMTARDLQTEAIKKGLPWSAAKGFDTFTPIGDFIPKDLIKDPSNVNLWLKVNNQMKQNGSTKEMVFKIPTLIEHVSSIMRLEKGDLILTGTPAGVGPIFAGDVITAGLNVGDKTLSQIEFPVVQRNRLNKL